MLFTSLIYILYSFRYRSFKNWTVMKNNVSMYIHTSHLSFSEANAITDP